MDFKNLIIGEKIKCLDDDDELAKLHFDDEYFSNLLLQEGNQEFYMETSVIKLIDYQWEFMTKDFMKGIFWFYMLCYIVPYSITLVNTNQEINRIVFNLCVLPQSFLLFIEMIQFYE